MMTEPGPRDGPTGRRPRDVIALTSVVPLVAALALVATLALTDDSGRDRASGGPGTSATVAIHNFTFSPDPDTVTARSTVTVVNDDGTAHTLTADRGAFDTGELAAGARGEITVGAPGRYRYHCAIHDYMTGTIVVR